MTARDKVFVLSFGRQPDPGDGLVAGSYKVLNSFDEASWKAPGGAIATATERLGIKVQELDI